MLPEVKTLRIDRETFRQTLEKRLADLPPLPAVVTRIMQTINDPNCSAEELNRLISLDQGLSSKILRIVNSAYYGFPKRISTITHAVVILGFNTVRNLVLGVSAFGMLSQKSSASILDRTQFWQHCVAAAIASSILAKKKVPKSRGLIEEAFLGGLLHDIGELFLDCYFPVQYAVTAAHAMREGITLREAEMAVLEIDHVSIGKHIAEHWNFPPSLTASIGDYDAPQPDSPYFPSAAIVQAADWVTWQAGVGVPENIAGPTMTEEVQAWLAFTEEDFRWLQNELETQFAAACDLMQVALSR
jgi:HD-like signal output (HDOD) protein